MKQLDINFAFVSGAQGRLGHALMNEFGGDPLSFCFGLHRTPPQFIGTATSAFPGGCPNKMWVNCDVSNFDFTKNFIQSMMHKETLRNFLNEASHGSFDNFYSDYHINIKSISLIHAVGPFKFEGFLSEEEAGPIDSDIWRLNYEAFKNMSDAVLEVLSHPVFQESNSPVHFKICTLGSVSEDYNVPLWHSFLQAKQKARSYIEHTIRSYKDSDNIKISGLYLRTSTIDTGNENTLRPRASKEAKQFWIKPEHVASEISSIMGTQADGAFKTKDVIEPIPGFEPEKYYANTKALQARWKSMMASPD